MIRSISPEERDAWNRLILENPDGGHIYQTQEWGEYKALYGWRAERLVWEKGTDRVYMQALVKNAPGFGTIWYIPKGPGIFAHHKSDKAQIAAFKILSRELETYIRKHDAKAFMLMIEPELYDEEMKPAKVGYQKSVHDLQFRATIIVDIDKDDDVLLASFKQKTRYNIRLATKKGVTMRCIS
jgi:lipid II:glycine glycyltransferase (peptidoglycan interpeptide bridge formation enzyme)